MAALRPDSPEAAAEWRRVMDADYFVEHGRWPVRSCWANLIVGAVLIACILSVIRSNG